MNINITYPKKVVEELSYPYWAVNGKGDLFLVTSREKGIFVKGWDTIGNISERLLTPLPEGTKIEIAV